MKLFTVKLSVLFCLLLVAVTFNGCQQRKTNPSVNQRLKMLLAESDYFQLRDELERVKSDLSKEDYLLYKAYCLRAADSCVQSNEIAKELLNHNQSDITVDMRFELLYLLYSNYKSMFQYELAVKPLHELLTRYRNDINMRDFTTLDSEKKLLSAIADVKPQKINKQATVNIPIFWNSNNLLLVPVSSGGVKDVFTFDTGANLSVVSRSMAEKMGMSLYEGVRYSVFSVSDFELEGIPAIADSIYIGDLLFENVIFIVLNDEDIRSSFCGYGNDGIIGFPVIRQMEEVRIKRKEGVLVVPKDVERKFLNNIVLDNSNVIVQLQSGNKKFSLLADTGAATSILSKRYFDSHKKEIIKDNELTEYRYIVLGGIAITNAYPLHVFPFKLGSKKGTLFEIPAEVEDVIVDEHYDGHLGLDALIQFDEVIINFKHMYIDFE